MKHNKLVPAIVLSLVLSGAFIPLNANEKKYVYEAGHPSLQEWLLPDQPPHPSSASPPAER